MLNISTTDTASPRSTQISTADKELTKKFYSRMMEGFIFLSLSLLTAMSIMGLLSPVKMIESGRAYILFMPLLIMIYGFERLGEGAFKLRKTLYLLAIILMALGFVPYMIVVITLPYSLYQSVYVEETIFRLEETIFRLGVLSRVGTLGMILLLIFMWRDLTTPHKEYTLVALVIAVIGLIASPDLMVSIASLIMAYNLHSLKKRLTQPTLKL